MKKLVLLITLISTNISTYHCNFIPFRSIQKCDSDWAIVGAGSAGIVTIGVLLDLGVLPERIVWIDPEFNIGRLSSYSTIIANSKNRTFVRFLECCKTFAECTPESIENLKQLNLEEEYPLETIIEPLRKITECLCKKVKTIKGCLSSLYFEDNEWKLTTDDKTFTSYNVVLATGSHPKTLKYDEFKNKEIPLDKALNQSILKEIVNKDDIVAVFGSSHSAILVLKYLTEMPVKQIINFYKSPIQYAIEIANLQLNINGLKGTTANWAKTVLEKNPPKNLVRIESKAELINKILPLCAKIVYAIGYQQNKVSNLKDELLANYNDTNGVIAPRLFGIGIAFPEKHKEPTGETEYKVGLKDFMEYAQKIVPYWMQIRKVKLPTRKHLDLLESFDNLFTIEVL